MELPAADGDPDVAAVEEAAHLEGDLSLVEGEEVPEEVVLGPLDGGARHGGAAGPADLPSAVCLIDVAEDLDGGDDLHEVVV